jgi:hypothetical protein
MASVSLFAARARLRPLSLSHFRLMLALTLLGFFPAKALAQNQAPNTVRLSKGYNLVGITRTTADNSIASLFPKPPANSLLFTYDNATGYSEVHNMDRSGGTAPRWLPSAPILPLGTAVIFMSPVEGFELELGGTPASTSTHPIYRGPNLICLTPAELAALPRTAKPGDRLHFYRSATWSRHTFTNERAFDPPLPDFADSPDPGLWYEASDQWSANQAGTFPIRPAVYLNNFVPALGVDLPIPPGSSTGIYAHFAFFAVFDSAGQPTAVDGGVHIFGNTIFEQQRLLRYVPPGSTTFGIGLRYRHLGFDEISRPIDARNLDPFVPIGLGALETLPYPGISRAHVRWLDQPSDHDALTSQTVNLSGRFGPEPAAALPPSLTNVTTSYQWDRLIGESWYAIRDATNASYQIANATVDAVGPYRLRARWAGETYVSRTASLRIHESADVAIQLKLAPAAELEFPTETGASYQVQMSTDTDSWLNLGDSIPGDGSRFRRSYPTESFGNVRFRIIKFP